MNIVIPTAALLFLCSSAGAQVTQVATIPPQAKGDSNRMVCEKEETIGTRLGARRVCLTVEQWKEKHREQREWTEQIQSGTYARDSVVDPAPGAHLDVGPQ
jgi:hypothetical protein